MYAQEEKLREIKEWGMAKTLKVKARRRNGDEQKKKRKNK